MRKLTIFTLIAVLAATGVAWAASITSYVTPNTPKKGSTLQVNATGPFGNSTGLPTSMVIDLQKGFTSTIKAVKELCTSQQENQNACPADSGIGQGNAGVAISPPIAGVASTQVILNFYLGKPNANGDIATVAVTETDPALGLPPMSTIGDLYPKNGGLELNFKTLPSYSSAIPLGVTLTLQRLYLSVAASNVLPVTTIKRVKVKNKKTGKTKIVKKKVTKRVRFHLINNPPKCPSSGTWTGSVTPTFATTGPVGLPLTFACSKK